ncbi:phosphate signaling complex protein PhoU [Virgibacillus siamensis]|uniref:phosphate signaling complex protein PhoU n=1 Tax=Virgibacillus siamensis TaxID=480071 RepID=UPI0009866295|nr:phosphate signaling complex protein PhoU [Virgibacillus siamensis]
MIARGQFETELNRIKDEISEMAGKVEIAFLEAVDALYNQDLKLANKVLEGDRWIDKQEIDINNNTILTITKQQPVATDLRQLIISLRITTDLERMADHAKNIAESAIQLGESYQFSIHPAFKEMRDLAIEMIHTAMNAFQQEDVSIAGKLSGMDDRLDNQYENVIRELLAITAEDEGKTLSILQQAFVARYIERIGDHITNLGESILFLVKGESYKLN